MNFTKLMMNRKNVVIEELALKLFPGTDLFKDADKQARDGMFYLISSTV